MNRTFPIVLALVASLVPAVSSAKCFSFRNSDIRVCIDGNDNATRRQAGNVCREANGSDCGAISGYSGECRTAGSTVCYDGSGSRVRSATAD